MKKISIFLLLMAFFAPLAMMGQETLPVHDNTTTPLRDGSKGTMRVYKRVSELNNGKNYLIVSSGTAGNAYALSQTSSTASTITGSSVHINAGDHLTGNVAYINSEGLEPTAVWTATKSSNTWKFSHSNYNIYAQRSGTFTFSYSLTVDNSSSTSWTYTNNNNTSSLSFSGSTSWFNSATFYITPSGSTFTLGTSTANVYLYEETDLNVVDITATVSPSGIGTVTGAGRYLYGSSCTLEATTNNSEYAFINWTYADGSPFSTENPCTFNARADQDLVANFESIVNCLTPTNLISSNVDTHSVTLNWDSDASNFNVKYRIMPDGEWQTTTASSNSLTLTGLVPETTYEAQVQTNCGDNNQSEWSDLTTFTTGIACFAPTNVTASNVTNNSAVISWPGEAESYNLRYGFNNDWSETITGVTSPYTLTNLADYTNYEVQVQANCGSIDGLSQWSASATFQTLDDCVAPFSQSTTDITPSGATLNWDGVQSNYNVRYRLAYYGHEQTIENFSGYTAADYDATGVLPTGWKGYSSGTLPHISNNSTLGTSQDITTIGGGQGGTDNFLYMVSNGTNPNTSYAILPRISHLLSVSFNYAFENASYGTLSVGYCTSNASGSSFVAFNDVNTNATTTNTRVTLTANDIAAINQHNGYLAFRWVCSSVSTLFIFTTDYGVGIDNITIDYVPNTGNEWMTETNVTSPLTINGLAYSGEYEWQVQGVDCDGVGSTGNWSASTIFTTLPAYVKHIDPYTNDGGYYLIASPVGQINPSEVGGMLDNDYDLYYFDQTQDLEWVNYKPGESSANAGFNLVPGKGYLYANSGNNGQGIDLVFTQGAYTGSGEVTLALESGAEFEGMNLVGNPFADTAYIADGRDFYRLAEGGAEIMTDASTGAIEPMEGVFVYAQSADEPMTFTTSAPGRKASRLVLNLSDDNDLVDRAMVRFGEGRMLPKFQLNENSTKVYMTVEDKEYAVVYSDEMGQIPVGFKAETNGTYTFDLSSEEVNLSYLHLIDNMTGNDVDLLVTPSYSFEAKTTDYESRFKLVFATGNNDNDDTFAFFSNGSFVINNEGKATLQVFDINGRILKSESINGGANININAAQGIYMLRLVNGDNVKVQKVVVR